MMCVNTYSLVKRVCVGHASYILSAVKSFPLHVLNDSRNGIGAMEGGPVQIKESDSRSYV